MTSGPDEEISFFTSNKPQGLPAKAVIGAMGFLGLRDSAPAEGRMLNPLFRGMTGLFGGSGWVLAEPVLGGPMAVMALEELLRRGVTDFIFLGLAGSITLDLKPGDLWCPGEALSTEGVSAHYPAPMEPDQGLRQSLLREAGKMGLAVQGGRHWSTDGFFRETAGIVERHRLAGAMAVDMESAGLWAAARFRGVRLASLMVVSDLLHNGEHHLGFELPEFRRALGLAARLAWRSLGVAS